MEKPIITSLGQITPVFIHKYERYLPTAFDESMTIVQKMNKVILHLNQIGEITNQVLDQWNQIMEWVMNDGLNESVIAKLDAMVLDGTLDTIINDHIFSLKADKTFVESEIARVETHVGLEIVRVETEVNKKANQDYVSTEIGTLTTEVNKKINSVDVSNAGKSGSYNDLSNKPLITNPDRRLKVGTWNIKRQYYNGVYQDITLNHRNVLIIESLDIVGLQELEVGGTATHANSRDPINGIANHNLGFRRFDKTIDIVENGSQYGNGLLTRYGTIKYTSTVLPNPSGSETRVLTSSEMYLNGKKIIVMNTHLHWEPHTTRYEQLAFIKNRLESLGNASWILTGDFNPLDRQEFSDYFGQWQIANGKNGVWFQTYPDPTYYGEKAIDNIICSNDLTIENVHMHNTSGLSDHNLFACDIVF